MDKDKFEKAKAAYWAKVATMPRGLVAMFDIQYETLQTYERYPSKTNVFAMDLKEQLDWYNNVALWTKNDPESFDAIVEEYASAIRLRDRSRELVAYNEIEMLRKLKGLEVIPDVPIYHLSSL